MYISEQLLNPNERRLRLSTQLGVRSVVLDNRGTELVSATGGVSAWDAAKLASYRQWVESFDLKLDVFALDVGAILLDSLVDLDSARKQRDVLAQNIQKAAARPAIDFSGQQAGAAKWLVGRRTRDALAAQADLPPDLSHGLGFSGRSPRKPL